MHWCLTHIQKISFYYQSATNLQKNIKTYEHKIFAHLIFLKWKCKYCTVQKLIPVCINTTIYMLSLALISYQINSKTNMCFSHLLSKLVPLKQRQVKCVHLILQNYI